MKARRAAVMAYGRPRTFIAAAPPEYDYPASGPVYVSKMSWDSLGLQVLSDPEEGPTVRTFYPMHSVLWIEEVI